LAAQAWFSPEFGPFGTSIAEFVGRMKVEKYLGLELEIGGLS
jgi:hypothetical protein